MKRKVRSDLKEGQSFNGVQVTDDMSELAGEYVEVSPYNLTRDSLSVEGSDWNWTDEMFEPIETNQINPNVTELKITKESVLAAAAKCSTAKATLETLFPEVFKVYTIHTDKRQVISDTKGDELIATPVIAKGYENLLALNDRYRFSIVKGPAELSDYLKVIPK